MSQERIDAFEKRRLELEKLSDAELKDRFWQLCSQVVEPIVDLAHTHTSPSIERSVLLRMGIDSLTAHAVVDRILQAGLLGRGAGHVVLEVAKKKNCDLRTAATAIIENKEILDGLFATQPEGK